MSLKVSSEGGNFEKCPIGTYVARCISVIDLGTQHGQFNNKPQVRKQVWILWEIPSEKMKDGRPFAVSSFYTSSLNEKANLRRDLEAWRGRAFTKEELSSFDLKNILDKPCLISVIHNEKDRVEISGVMALPKGTPVPTRINELLHFDVDEWDQSVFEKIPDGIQEIIKKSEEYAIMHTPGAAGEPGPLTADAIPF